MHFTDVTTTFADFGMSRDLIDRISQRLQTSSTTLDGNEITQVADGSFGATSGGKEMGAQTALAHAYVVEAITSIAADLQEARRVVIRLEEQSVDNDLDSARDLETVPAVYHPTGPTGPTTREA